MQPGQQSSSKALIQPASGDVELQDVEPRDLTAPGPERDDAANTSTITLEAEPEDDGPSPSLGKLLGLASHEMPLLILAFVLHVFAELAGLMIPLVLTRGYDAVVEDLEEDNAAEIRTKVAEVMIFVLVLHFASMLVGFSRALIMGICGEKVVARLRNRLFAHILQQEIGFFDNRKTGELVSRLGSDTTLIQLGTTQALAETTMGIIKAVVSIALMFVISAKMTGVILGVCCVLLLFSAAMARWIGAITTAYQDALGKAAMVSTEAFGAMRTLRSFGCEQVEVERYARNIGSPAGECFPPKSTTTLYFGVRKALAIAAFAFLGLTVGLGTLYATMWFGFELYITGELSIGELSAFQSYIFQVGFALAQAGGNVAKLFEALGGARRILQLLDRGAHDDAAEGGVVASPADLQGEVRFEAVGFAYPSRPERTVLSGFTLHVPAKSVAAIVGSSGSGKSTALALLARFYQPLEGRVTVDNIDIRCFETSFLRQHMALVQQEPILFGLSIKENVCYGCRGRTPTQEEVQAVCEEANAHAFIASFPEGYDTLVGERGVKLSGGQKQRVAIARALITQPRILLLDEATSALDAESERVVQEAIDRTMVGRTVLVVAHRLSTVRDAHQIAVAVDGKVADVGRHSELLGRCQVYQALVKRQT